MWGSGRSRPSGATPHKPWLSGGFRMSKFLRFSVAQALFTLYNAHKRKYSDEQFIRRTVQLVGRVKPFGVPFNIASYALLTLMVAQVCDLQPGEFIWTGGDCHLYANHLEQADLQLTREPLPLPTMKLNPEVKHLFAFRFEDFELVGYEAHPHIKAPVAV